MFNRPYRTDFIFWLFIALVVLQIVSAIVLTNESGGIDTSAISLTTGLIDFTFRLLQAYLFILPILLARKVLRHLRNKRKSATAL